MLQRSQNSLRLGALAFAAFLGLQAFWILATEIVRPKVAYFPGDKAASEIAAAQRGSAQFAAWIGIARGDIWADYAITLLSQLLADGKDTKAGDARELTESTRSVAITAAKLAPTDARIWLLLAMVDQRLDWLGRGIPGPLKMSYYTGPNVVALMPSRLLIATRSAAITDPELQDLVGREIRTIVTRRPDLRPALFVAYRDALPEGRKFIDSKVSDLDSNLMASIRASVPAQATTSPQGASQPRPATTPVSPENAPRQ